MDEQLKRRLMGAGILSILAVIIVPYFFEDKAPKTATELPLPVESHSLALPKDESAVAGKAQVESPTSQSSQPTQAPKKRAYTVVPLEEPKAQVAPTPSGPSEDLGQAQEDYPEEPVSENRAPVILDPKAPQPKAALTPKLQHPQTDAPSSRAAPETVKPPVKKPEVVKPVKPAAAPATPVADLPKKSVVSPAPATPSKSAPAPQSPTKPAPASGYLVQAGTFSDENNAKALVEKLKKRSLPVRMQVVEGLNGKVYRVTVGPNLDHGRAEQIQKQLSEQDGVRGLILQGH